MGDKKAPTFSAITGRDLQSFALPKKSQQERSPDGGATSGFESPMSTEAA
jgi:hypothetical protein